MRDGFFINGVDGKLVGPDDKGVYKFIADSDISDDKAVIKAGTAVELLASIGLSKMVENLPRLNQFRVSPVGKSNDIQGQKLYISDLFSAL